MYKFLVMFCCLYLIVVDTLSVDEMDRPIQLCGEKLAEAVRIICRGKYHFEYSREKRNYLLNTKYNDGVENMIGWGMSYPLLTEESAKNFVPIKGRRGIVDECCKKPCTRRHLRLYCAD